MNDDGVVAATGVATGAGLPAARRRLGPGAVTMLALAALLLWDALGADLPLARLAGDGSGFPWRQHWLFTTVLHDGARVLAWLLIGSIAVGLARPWGPLRGLSRAERWQLLLAPLLATGTVSLLKQFGGTSCPWDLQAFGGHALDLPHWISYLGGDAGPGHCFPAGHASAGFGFVAGWFVFRDSDPLQARRWLLGSLGVGLLLGLSQQWRGAHFASHTAWAAWACFVVALLSDAARRRLEP